MQSAWLPLFMKYSPMAVAAYGAIHLIGAASDAGAVTIIVYSMAPRSFRSSWICATVDAFWPIAT